MLKAFFHKCFAYGLWGVVLLFAFNGQAMAAAVDDMAESAVKSADKLPALIAVFAYIIGLISGVSGILKLKEHVDNPNNTPLRTPIIRLLIGGGLFSLPIVYETMFVAINGDDKPFDFDPGSI